MKNGVGELMNDTNHVIECDFEGAKTLKLSGKNSSFGRFLQFFGENQKKAQNLAEDSFFSRFENHKFARDRLKIQQLICNLA